jgi:ferredoxin
MYCLRVRLLYQHCILRAIARLAPLHRTGKYKIGTNAVTSCATCTSVCGSGNLVRSPIRGLKLMSTTGMYLAGSCRTVQNRYCATCQTGKYKLGTNGVTSCYTCTSTCSAGIDSWCTKLSVDHRLGCRCSIIGQLYQDVQSVLSSLPVSIGWLANLCRLMSGPQGGQVQDSNGFRAVY